MTRAPTLARVASTLAGFTTLGKIVQDDGGTTALTLPQHFGTVIDIRSCLDDPTTTDITTALTTAITKAVLLGGAAIYIPKGTWQVESAVNITVGTIPLKIFGDGAGVTRIACRPNTTIFQYGNHTITRQNGGFYVSDLTFLKNGTNQTGNPFFSFQNAQNIFFERVYTSGTAWLFEIGSQSFVGTSDSVVNFRCSNCNFSGALTNSRMITLNSAAVVWFDQCKFDGNGSTGSMLFNISPGTERNVDGFWLTQCLAENWPISFNCAGKGISNMVVLGGAYDRYTGNGCAYFRPAALGIVRWVSFVGVNLGVGVGLKTGVRCVTLDASLGTIYGVTLDGCDIMSAGSNGVYVSAGCEQVAITNNKFSECGHDGTAIVQFDASSGVVSNNVSARPNAIGVAPTYGIAWGGTPGPLRKSFGNSWADVTTAQESGQRFDNTWNLEDYFLSGQRVSAGVDISSAITRMISAIAASGLTSATINFPSGTMRQDSPIDWTALGLAINSTGMAITIRGQGRDCTTINYADLDDVCWNFGNHGTLTYKWTDITITGISFQQIGIPTGDNACMYFRNCRRVHLEQIGLYSFRVGLKLGDPTVSDSLHRFKLVNSYSEPSHLYTPYWFELGSGSAFEFINNTNNMPQRPAGAFAGTVALFKCTNTASNLDGVRILDGYMSQFDRYLDINNVRGIANLWWIGGIYDRPTSGIAVYCKPTTEQTRWMISKVVFQGGEATGSGVPIPPNTQQAFVFDGSLAAGSGNRAITSLNIEGCNFKIFGGITIEIIGASVRGGRLIGNGFEDCGHNGNLGGAAAGSGVPCIVVNTGSSVVCTNNQGWRNDTSAVDGYGPFTYTVSMPGAATTGRYRDDSNTATGVNVSGGVNGADTP
jgi:hypothetical protein